MGYEGIRPAGRGAGLRPAGRGGPSTHRGGGGPLVRKGGCRPLARGEGVPHPRRLPMQAAPLVASDVFAVSSLSIGVWPCASVACGFRSGRSSTARSTPNTPSVPLFGTHSLAFHLRGQPTFYGIWTLQLPPVLPCKCLRHTATFPSCWLTLFKICRLPQCLDHVVFGGVQQTGVGFALCSHR